MESEAERVKDKSAPAGGPEEINVTERLLDEVERCEDIDDLRNVLKLHSEFYTNWKTYINRLVDCHGGYSINKFAAKCGFSKNTVRSWCNQGLMPRSRKEYIKLGMGLGMAEDEINRLLQRYAKYPRLYAKSIDDVIYLFAIHNRKDFAYTEKLREALLDKFEKIEFTRESVRRDITYSTSKAYQDLLSIQFEDELVAFIDSNLNMFATVYNDLIKFIDNYIMLNTFDYVKYAGDDSLHFFLKTKTKNTRLVSLFDNMVTLLRKHRVIPDKTKLIAFGLYLNMSLSDMNLMLRKAGMEPLCARDKAESVVIFALNDIFLKNPDIELSNKQLLERFVSDDGLKAECRRFIHTCCDYDYQSEFTDEDVTEYVKNQLENIDLDDMKDLLDLL